jgi:HEAT repeat protein
MRSNLPLRLVGSVLFLLAGCGPKGPDIGGKPFSEWVSELTDSDAGVRRRAVQNLGNAGAAAEPAVPHIIPMLGDKDETVRAAATGALHQIGKPAAAALAKAIKSDDRLIRCGAAVALARLEPTNPDNISALLEAAAAGRDVSKEVRAEAHLALHKVGAGGVPALIKGMSDPDIEVRRRSADALGSIGPAAKAAVPLLEKMAADRTDEYGQRMASASLIKITGKGEKFTENRDR